MILKKPIDLKRLYWKNIWRIVCAVAFWHIFYAAYTFLFEDRRKAVAVHLLINGYSHLWFLHMIIGLYLLVPLLRKITASLPLTRYFLLLAVIFSIILPTFFGIYNSLTQYHTFPFAIKTVISSFSGLTTSVYFSFTLWFVTYFVAGYYFNHVTLTKKTRLVIYVLAVLGLIVTFLGTNGLSLRYDDRVTPLYSYMSLNVAASALGLFVFIKELSRKIDWTGKASRWTHWMVDLSRLTFGIYLVHFLFVHLLTRFGHAFEHVNNALIAVPIISILVFILALLTTMGIYRLPWFKDHIM